MSDAAATRDVEDWGHEDCSVCEDARRAAVGTPREAVLEEALRGIASLRSFATLLREKREGEIGMTPGCRDDEREAVARAYEHAAHLAEEALQ